MKYNVVMLYHPNGQHVLMCLRQKNPYKGKYNFVGGKMNPGESPLDAAYRELQEETGITEQAVTLLPVMTLQYHLSNLELYVFAGMLRTEIPLVEELNPLEWVNLNESFFDLERFAGEGNIGHMVAQVDMYWEKLFGEKQAVK